MRAIFTIDPGNATGVAWGVFDTGARSVEDAIKSALDPGSLTLNHRAMKNKQRIYLRTDSAEVGRLDDMQQAIALYAMFLSFKQHAVNIGRMDPDDVELVIEDFTLLPGPHSGGKDGVAPVRVAWALAGVQAGRSAEYIRRHKKMHITPIRWQEPSSMGVCPDARLRNLGLWIPGRDHERDAWRHLVARLNKIIA